MHSLYDYQRFGILYVDDEEMSLKYFRMAFESKFRIFTAASAEEGFRILEANRDAIAILMTDQRMPGEKGVQLLEKARQFQPRIIRMLATAYSDMDAAVSAVNTGAIYKYISKPWDVPELETVLRRALEFFIVQRERDQLLREKMAVLHNMMITDRVVSLGVVASGLGHYVRNSLVAVRTFLDLAPAKLHQENVDLDDLRDPNFWQEFYKHVQSQVTRIAELLGQLSSATHKAGGEFTDEVRLGSVIAEVLAALAPKTAVKALQLENLVAADLPAVKGDQGKLRQLVELMILDAVMILPSGSKLSLRGATEVAADGQVDRVVLEFEDNGPGLPDDSLRVVFDPFFVRNNDPQDFGINLMTCYFIVYHHSGTVEVRTRPGGGNTFRITLPLKPSSRSTAEAEQEFLSKVLMNETLWERLLAGV